MQIALKKSVNMFQVARYSDVSSARIYDDGGRLIVYAMETAAGVFIMTADDPDFESEAQALGIPLQLEESDGRRKIGQAHKVM